MDKIGRLFIRTIWVALAAAALLAACVIAEPPTPASPTPTTPTGIAYVDKVIAAALSADTQRLKSLFVLRTVPCTPEKWLLRQPLCRPGETEGTPVQTMPLLSDDLGHLRKSEIDAWHGIGDVQLYAVYRTGDYTYADEFFPAGEYAVALVPKESAEVFILQVTREGIVRIDFCRSDIDICNGASIEEILQDHESAFILGPLPIGE